jgi:hypothetical protein
VAPRLKVFVTSDGLTDFVVATTSKAKALAAWGVRQDVFKEGHARETGDPELVAAATARPGEVLRRPAATRGELAKAKPLKAPEAKGPEPKGPSKAALKAVADLEAQFAELASARTRDLETIARERAELDRRAETLDAQHAARRKQLEDALSAAKRALE